MRDLLEVVREAWAFTGLDAVRVEDVNSFGNLLFEDVAGAYWRICPEELACSNVAASAEELAELRATEDFRVDWAMAPLVQDAQRHLGPLKPGQCYHLVRPVPLGGSYGIENTRVIAMDEWLWTAGSIARQIKDLPDGAQVRLQVIQEPGAS